jgi:hypothetical protein
LSAVAANLLGLALVAVVIAAWELGLLWRVGSWLVSPAESLTLDEGLPLTTIAPQIACHDVDGREMHLDFEAKPSLVVFGMDKCKPCEELLWAASRHPATRQLRRVYVADAGISDLDPSLLADWEVYTFIDERSCRATWRAPVSPYFYVIDASGHVMAKGVANRPDHLDRLLHLRPPRLAQSPRAQVLSLG